MTQVTTLPNQVRVVTDEMKDVETVSLGIWVSVGSRYEEESISGISHLLEHMAFKGTTSRSALQIAEQIEDVGGVINAYTSRDVTAYYVKVLKQDVPLAMDILSDIFQNSVMDAEELSREKGVILQEINQTYDAPDDAIYEYFQKTAYPNQAVGRSILGTAKTVQSVTPQTLLDYMHGEYAAPRVIVSAAGHVKHETMVELASKLLTKLSPHGQRTMENAVYRGGEFKMEKANEQVNLLLGFEGVSYEHPLFYAQMVLATVLGGGMSSRLFQEIREKRGLVYSIYAHAASYQESGVFSVYAGTGEKEVVELLPVVCDELLKAGSTLTDVEINRAKTQLKASLLMRRESTSSRCDSNARNMAIYGRPIPKEESIRKIDGVNADMLSQTMALLLSSRPTLATLGPVKRVMDYDKMVDLLGR